MSGGIISPTFSAAQSGGPSGSLAALFGPETDSGKRLHLLAHDTERFLREVWVPRASNLQFQIDAVLFQAKYEPEEENYKLQLWSVLGYLPYSVEDWRKRRLLIEVLEGARGLARVKFGVNRENQIIVTQTLIVPSIQPPPFIFIPLMPFLQEALPFIRLIGECL